MPWPCLSAPRGSAGENRLGEIGRPEFSVSDRISLLGKEEWGKEGEGVSNLWEKVVEVMTRGYRMFRRD